ncbi:RagB/SusD family nutrient uptake outer membrane protein [Solitalea koreensis]|uniref:SusD family protein n=1 Tax=Solitalea koreensis TaxID=543615 RepID=A0A521APL4_9SPHI|nr:RagB/SusD family nutrient uptake outer membrane protein [Solitalea koreensis]SMO36711.1 SusD family protein [Solitalea koreensis]
MKRHIMKLSSYIKIAAMSLLIFACSKEYLDPQKAVPEEVFDSPSGLTAVVTGIQRVYTNERGSSLYNVVTANGFLSKELFLVNPGNIAEGQLNAGGSTLDGTNTIILGLWSTSNKIIFESDRVITNALLLNDKNYASGLIAYATIFKAIALGDLAMYWQQVPDGNGVNVGFISSTDGFNRAITEIDQALAAITANPISSTFLGAIPPGIDIVNSLNALKARYALYIGNNALALSTANSVDLTKKSSFNFDAITLNPIFQTATATNNVYQPVDSTLGLPVGLQPDLLDKRVPFYTTINTTIAPRFRINGFAVAGSTPWPVYLPGEIMLTKAEAYTRQGDLVNGLIELNKVVTKTAATDVFGVGAALPPIASVASQQELLDLIYKHRCIELYMSGLKLIDMRRFNRPVSEMKRSFFPYPFAERDNNPNTPPDPAF